MEWSRRILLQRELDAADNLERWNRMAEIIKGEPDKVEREIMMDMISETLGGEACEYINGLLRKAHVEISP